MIRIISKYQTVFSLIVILSFWGISIAIPLNFINPELIPSQNPLYFFANVIFLVDFFSLTYINKKRTNSNLNDFFQNTDKITFFSFLTNFLPIFPFYLFPTNFLWVFPFFKIFNVSNRIHIIKDKSITNRTLVTFSIFIFWFTQVAHWISCGWFAIYQFSNTSFYDNYILSLYWTITSLSTVGFGDIVAQNTEQRLFSIFVMIAGVGFYGYLIGSFSSLLSYRDPAQKKYQTNLENLSTISKYRKLPVELQHRIQKYFHYAWQEKLGFDENEFVNQLPHGLKIEVFSFLRKDALMKVDIFADLSSDLIEELSQKLQPIVVTPDEFLFREGEIGDKMYFLIKGEIQILQNETEIARIFEGDFLGEISLFKNQTRNATAKAVTYCNLYYLDRENFNKIIHKNDKIYQKIHNQILLRETKMDE